MAKPERWVPVLVLGGQTTPEQRARNCDLYKRIRDGVPEAEREGLRGGPLHHFVFDVPMDTVRMGPVSGASPRGSVSFRLDPDGECYRRLLSCIADNFHTSCDADAEVARIRAQRERDCEAGRRFQLHRDTDVSGVSGTGIVAQGVLFTTGKCSLAWLTAKRSVAVYDSLDDLEAIHCHGGATRLVWVD